MHGNIRFTFEIGSESLLFLDTEISIKGADFESWVYRKKTDTSVILHDQAVCPPNWKSGVISCFLNRAWLICSNNERFKEEVKKIKSIFMKNGYTERFVENHLKTFLDKQFNSAHSQEK